MEDFLNSCFHISLTYAPRSHSAYFTDVASHIVTTYKAKHVWLVYFCAPQVVHSSTVRGQFPIRMERFSLHIANAWLGWLKVVPMLLPSCSGLKLGFTIYRSDDPQPRTRLLEGPFNKKDISLL